MPELQEELSLMMIAKECFVKCFHKHVSPYGVGEDLHSFRNAVSEPLFLNPVSLRPCENRGTNTLWPGVKLAVMNCLCNCMSVNGC